jgi:hypothetical protein
MFSRAPKPETQAPLSTEDEKRLTAFTVRLWRTSSSDLDSAGLAVPSLFLIAAVSLMAF